MSILRVQKNKENPYVIINKKFLEDPKISLKLKGFLAYCLSKPDDWKFHVRQLAGVLKESKNAIYSVINEGIKHGYIERDIQKNNGRFEAVDYIIHESKINYTVSRFPDTEGADAEDGTLLSNDLRSSSSSYEEDRGMKEEITSASPPRLVQPPPKKELPKEAQEIAKKILDKVKSVHPKAKDPNLDKWGAELDLLNRKDSRSWEEMHKMIDWAFEDAFWYKQIQSPDALRKHWDKMAMQMASYSNKGLTERKNRDIANEVKSHLEKTDRANLLWIGKDFVRNQKTGDDITFALNSEKFEEILCKWFNLRKNNEQI